MKAKGKAGNPPRRVSELRNIGRLIAKRLGEVGVETEDDLRRIGAIAAHQRIKNNYPDQTLPVCYYLYSFAAALRDVHWNDLSDEEKQGLKKEVSEQGSGDHVG